MGSMPENPVHEHSGECLRISLYMERETYHGNALQDETEAVLAAGKQHNQA
jgi:hypothetical protein